MPKVQGYPRTLKRPGKFSPLRLTKKYGPEVFIRVPQEAAKRPG